MILAKTSSDAHAQVFAVNELLLLILKAFAECTPLTSPFQGPSGQLRNEQWQFFADISGQPIGLIIKGQTLEDGADRLSRNVAAL
jgi:hypothetical protein